MDKRVQRKTQIDSKKEAVVKQIDTLKKKLQDNTKMSKDLKNVKNMLDKQDKKQEFGFYDDIEDEVDHDLHNDFAWIEDEVEGIDDILKEANAAT